MILICSVCKRIRRGRFSHDSHMSDSQESTESQQILRRRIIDMTDDFDIVHNVLYYMYTNCITFSTVNEDDLSPNESVVPRICAAEDIFAIAHRLSIKSLQIKALHFLEATCNVRNITCRVLSDFASLYEELWEVYKAYFKENWAEIRCTAEFREYFSTVDEIEDASQIRRIFKAFRELMVGSEFISE